MKKIFAVLLIAMLALCGYAMAEDLTGDIEDGCYVIRLNAKDEGWIADDMAQDDTVVKLESAEYADGVFTVKYAPVGDGSMTVGLRHYTGIACDQYHTMDLTVADGAIQEAVSGSYTASPDLAIFDPFLFGRWDSEDGMATMIIGKNPGGSAWDVEITAAEGQGAYVFKTTVYFDCELNAFVYDKGKFWKVPITDSDAAEPLGEADVAGTTGRFAIIGEEDDLHLDWYDDQSAGETLEFWHQKSDYTYYPESEAYVGNWASGDFALKIAHSEEDYNLFCCAVTRMDADGKTGECWVYDSCGYDDIGRALSCEMIGIHSNITVDEDDECVSADQLYDDGAASFALNEDGTLTWTDHKQGPGEDTMVFTKAE